MSLLGLSLALVAAIAGMEPDLDCARPLAGQEMIADNLADAIPDALAEACSRQQ